MFVTVTSGATDVNLLFLLWEKKEDDGNEMKCQNIFLSERQEKKEENTNSINRKEAAIW